MRSRSIELG